MSQGVIKIALAMAFAALLPSCFGAQVNTRAIGPVALAYNFTKPSPAPTETPQPQPSLTVGQVSPGQGAVEVRGFHEPPDWAHRNYCGAGATQVLLSAWMTDVPDIETVAKASKLNPNSGEFGANAATAINGFLNPVVVPALGQPRYTAEHITTLEKKVADLDKSLNLIEQSFYAENDPNYRDDVIQKRFEQTKRQLGDARKELADARDALAALASK